MIDFITITSWLKNPRVTTIRFKSNTRVRAYRFSSLTACTMLLDRDNERNNYAHSEHYTRWIADGRGKEQEDIFVVSSGEINYVRAFADVLRHDDKGSRSRWCTCSVRFPNRTYIFVVEKTVYYNIFGRTNRSKSFVFFVSSYSINFSSARTSRVRYD